MASYWEVGCYFSQVHNDVHDKVANGQNCLKPRLLIYHYHTVHYAVISMTSESQVNYGVHQKVELSQPPLIIISYHTKLIVSVLL